jgi:hypothetical protein
LLNGTASDGSEQQRSGRLLDRQVGIDTGKSDQDIPSLLQVYEFIERMTGKPQHPTCPLVDLAEYE